MHQLVLPITGLEEDSADGFAAFSTIYGLDGPGPALGAATLFDEIASRQGEFHFEEYSTDHPLTQQRTYNFLCFVVGSDPQRLQNSLVSEGYLPLPRAYLCPLEWAQLNYGWWTVLEPYINTGFSANASAALIQAREELEAQYKAQEEIIKKVRNG